MDTDGKGLPDGVVKTLTTRKAADAFRHSLESLDDLDRRIILALQQDGRASWTSIAEACNTSVPTVVRHGQQLIADGVVRVTALPQLGSQGPVDLFFLRIACLPGTQTSVAAALAANPNTRFVSVVTGRYDIMAELAVTGGSGSYAGLIEQLQTVPDIERWRSDLVMHVYKVAHHWGRQLYGEALGLPPLEDDDLTEPPACEPTHFDEVDLKLIDELKEDGRLTFKALGERLGINESSARRRLERLRSNGCLSIVTLFSAAALGFGAETLITVQADPSRLESVAHELAKMSEVRYIAAILDGNSLMCEVITRSTDDLYKFMTSTLGRMDGVRGWEASMELLSLKRGFVETAWWRAQAHPAAVPDS
ncbi:Lrp/AsnC family transcriptional regulator [Gryllotalpicola kribbensis]|jgi:DNA-binding Lrp family transcriptional regulator|uniref:Lrp/AsnC family transcriptional regulator n=1 Tax=Gryllotalpicola kribbensis TaxID=993084 RepID=A0ABP8AFS1_9MICO